MDLDILNHQGVAHEVLPAALHLVFLSLRQAVTPPCSLGQLKGPEATGVEPQKELRHMPPHPNAHAAHQWSSDLH